MTKKQEPRIEVTHWATLWDLTIVLPGYTADICTQRGFSVWRDQHRVIRHANAVAAATGWPVYVNGKLQENPNG